MDDPEWGRRVVAAVVPAAGAPAPALADVRRTVAAELGPHAAPRQLLVLGRAAAGRGGQARPGRRRPARGRAARGGFAAVATRAQWISGARPRTLPAAVSPVVAGTGAAAGLDGADGVRAVLALVVALALQVAVNYANDYSDGIRGHRRRAGRARSG